MMIRQQGFNRTVPMRALAYLGVLVTLFAILTTTCGVESCDRRPARQGESQILEFHRTPVTAFEQFRMALAKEDES